MNLSKVDLNLFLVFDVIYSERNLTRAAEVLCLTQPTVSNALARLRSSLNDELFVRTPKGMIPTPLTENIIGRVRDALQLLDTSVMEGDIFDPATCERTFRISMNDFTEALLLPELMNELGRHAPGMRIESYYTRRSDLQVALSSGQLELAIDLAGITNPQFCHAPLMQENYVCAVRRDRTDIGDKLTLEQYLGLGHVHVSSRRRGLGVVDMELNKLGYQRQIRMRLQHYLVAAEIVRHSDLAMTVPGNWLHRTDLRIIELPFELPVLASQLLWHRSADGDQANRWLREKIIALCA